MQRLLAIVSLVSAAGGAALLPSPVRAQQAAPLGGVWSLNRSLSEFPADMGFNPAWMTGATREGGPGTGANGSGRGRRGSSGGGSSRDPASPFSPRQENYEDARRIQLLTAEARNPPSRLTIVETPVAVTMTNELGQSRTLHPDGKEETVEIQGAPIGVTSHRDGDQLVVSIVWRKSVSFATRMRPRRIRRGWSSTCSSSSEEGATSPARLRARPHPTPSSTGAAPSPRRRQVRAARRGASDQRPGAELKGLRSLGVWSRN